MLRVLIVGGYGNFGGYVARSLCGEANIQLIIAGRSKAKARAFAQELAAHNAVEAGAYDLTGSPKAMAALAPDLVINMVGPYNEQGYGVAEAAIACGAHYCDIADAREFVAGIGTLDGDAQKAGVAVLAGASSVPALTAAYLDEIAMQMREITSVEYGISGAEQANRGAGTVAAVLSYVGQRFSELREGRLSWVTGWTGTRAVRIPGLGLRWFGRGNVPDLALFKQRYPSLQDHSFWAGHEITVLHFGTRMMGALAALGFLPRLDRFAGVLARVSKLFNWLGKGQSGFFLFAEGKGPEGKPLSQRHYIVARQGHGPYIPCFPVILIAKKLAAGEAIEAGARACLGVISLREYQDAFLGLDIEVIAG